MSVTVTPVSGRRDLDAFIKLPFRLYRDDPSWVPPLLYLERQRFEPKTNPFLQHAEAQLFLARRNGQVVGRISAQVDNEHNRFHEERTGFFGFFESEDDPETAQALFGVAEGWLRERGMEAARLYRKSSLPSCGSLQATQGRAPCCRTIRSRWSSTAAASSGLRPGSNRAGW